MLKDIKEFVKIWKSRIAERVSKIRGILNFVIVQVGDVEASNRYVRNKVKDCAEVGIPAYVHKVSEQISQEELIDLVKKVQRHYNGIMVQLPLPKHIDARKVATAIDPKKDVDGFLEWSKFDPCTPLGIMRYLEYCEFELEGADVVVIGRSNIVGKPMAKMLTDANATVTLCHSKTKNLESKLASADLIICAVGKAGFINAEDYDVPIIDVGINFVDGKLVGDVSGSAPNVTPVPGGVGLLTRCALLENIVKTIEN